MCHPVGFCTKVIVLMRACMSSSLRLVARSTKFLGEISGLNIGNRTLFIPESRNIIHCMNCVC